MRCALEGNALEIGLPCMLVGFSDEVKGFFVYF